MSQALAPPGSAANPIPLNAITAHLKHVKDTERLVATSAGFITINNLQTYLNRLPANEVRAELQHISKMAAQDQIHADEVTAQCYEIAQTSTAGITGTAHTEFLKETFPDIEAVLTRKRTNEQRREALMRTIIRYWGAEAPKHRVIAQEINRTRIAAIQKVAKKKVRGDKAFISLHEGIRAACRATIARLQTPQWKQGTHCTTNDFDTVAKASHPEIQPWTEEEKRAMFQIRDYQLVILDDSSIIPKALADTLGLWHYPVDLPSHEPLPAGNSAGPSQQSRDLIRNVRSNMLIQSQQDFQAQEASLELINSDDSDTSMANAPRADSSSSSSDSSSTDRPAPVPGSEPQASTPAPPPAPTAHSASSSSSDSSEETPPEEPHDAPVQPNAFITRRMASNCTCSPIIKRQLVNRIAHAPKNDQARVHSLIHWVVEDLFPLEHAICHQELKAVASAISMFKRNISYDTLRTRLIAVNGFIRDNILREKLATKPEAYWFNLDKRATRAADLRDQYKYESSPPWSPDNLPNNFDYVAFLGQFFPGLENDWVTEGSVNIDVFKWFNDEGLMEIFREEFRMYKHHLRYRPNTQDQGWARNQYHSLAQQTVRQDPLYWLCYVCLRPDHGWMLISYPYYTKFASLGAHTGFKHMDINPFRAANENYGINMIQGSVSLTDEDPNNCTIILPGMHHWWSDWVQDVLASRVKIPTGPVVGLGRDIYTAVHQNRYKDWTPAPCTAGQARITHPTVGHGSTEWAGFDRMTILAWFELIAPDHKTLETPEGGSFDELANGHRDLMPARLTPSGHPVMYGTTPYPFPAAVHLSHATSIGGAMVGRIPWNSGSVALEMYKIFTGSPESLRDWIANYRKTTAENVKAQWKIVQELERLHFGHKSYFVWVDNGRRPEEILNEDDPDPNLEFIQQYVDPEEDSTDDDDNNDDDNHDNNNDNADEDEDDDSKSSSGNDNMDIDN